MDRDLLIKKAQQQATRLQKLRRDPRYLKTLGKLKRAGFLDVRDVPQYRGQVFLQDALWAAELEPRIYELLPAILARRPKFFAHIELPDDLDRVVKEIKAGHPRTPYQDITPEKYGQWIAFVGRDSRTPKILKAFRLSVKDIETLNKLSKELSLSQAEILSQALHSWVKR